MTTQNTHPLPPGALVTINTSLNGCPFVEGRGRIISPFGREPHRYLVQFENEAVPQIRLVLPEWQETSGSAVGKVTPSALHVNPSATSRAGFFNALRHVRTTRST
jgi:hypothetical protein